MQLELKLGPDPEPVTIDERFAWFHRRNPQVYAELVRLARNAKHRGVRRVGIGMLWEVLRWEMHLEASDRDEAGPRLTNDYRSRYARMIMQCEPDLRDLFEVRELKA